MKAFPGLLLCGGIAISFLDPRRAPAGEPQQQVRSVGTATPVAPERNSARIIRNARQSLSANLSQSEISDVIFSLMEINPTEPEYKDSVELTALAEGKSALCDARRDLRDKSMATSIDLAKTITKLNAIPQSCTIYSEGQSLVALLQKKIDTEAEEEQALARRNQSTEGHENQLLRSDAYWNEVADELRKKGYQ